MTVDRTQVEAMARLGQLEVDEAEAERLAAEMTRILEHADRLRGLSTAEDAAVGGQVGDGGEDEGAHADRVRRGKGGADRSERADQADQADQADVGGPDRLHRAPADFAPRFEDGFFLVPPPPGVTPSGRPTSDE